MQMHFPTKTKIITSQTHPKTHHQSTLYKLTDYVGGGLDSDKPRFLFYYLQQSSTDTQQTVPQGRHFHQTPVKTFLGCIR